MFCQFKGQTIPLMRISFNGINNDPDVTRK